MRIRSLAGLSFNFTHEFVKIFVLFFLA